MSLPVSLANPRQNWIRRICESRFRFTHWMDGLTESEKYESGLKFIKSNTALVEDFGYQSTRHTVISSQILPKIWTTWVGHTNVTDDRQTYRWRRTGNSSSRSLKIVIIFAMSDEQENVTFSYAAEETVGVLFSVLFQSLAVLDPRVGHTMDVLSPFISILCHSDRLFHRESCPRLDVVYSGRAWSSSPAYSLSVQHLYILYRTLRLSSVQ